MQLLQLETKRTNQTAISILMMNDLLLFYKKITFNTLII